MHRKSVIAMAMSKPKITITPKPKQRPMIELANYQRVHVDQLSRILEAYPVGMDLSMLGSGKTYTSSYIALNHPLNFKHVVVVCPLSLRPKWTYMREHYRVPILHIETYNSVRSVKCQQPKHGLLRRVDYKQVIKGKDGEDTTVDKIDFLPTDELHRLVSEGLLLLIDEFHHVKNTTAQFFSCQALIKAIMGDSFFTHNPSRVLLISGSPFDKSEQIVNMFRLVNIMTDNRLTQFNAFTYEHEWIGFREIVEFAMNVNSRARDIVPVPWTNTGTATQLRDVSYNLFQKVIKPVLASSMRLILPIPIDKFNGFYDITDEMDRKLLYEGVNKLRTSTGFNGQEVNFGPNVTAMLAGITCALRTIETAKIATMIRVVKEHLLQNPTSKAVVCVNYSDTIIDLAEGLQEYNPLILNGSTKDAERGSIIAQFGSYELTHRLLLGNMKVCSTGIDLDDKFGDRPRFCLVSPNYSSIDLYQICHRFLRMDTKSKATVHMVYGKQACELSILNALAAKGRTMKDTTDAQVEDGVIFPCDFTAYTEPTETPVCKDIIEFIQKQTGGTCAPP